MNKEFTPTEIISLADSLLIGVNEEEANEIIDRLTFIRDSIDGINVIENIDQIEALTHPFDLFESTLREDTDFTDGDRIEDLLSNADFIQGREVEVPKVVG